MKTTVSAGRAWHYKYSIGRQTAEHNESKFGRTGGSCSPMDIAVLGECIFILSRGFGYTTNGYYGDLGNRIGKTTFDEEHLGDFARYGFTWPNSLAISAEGNVFCSDEYENKIYAFGPDQIITFPEANPNGESIFKWGSSGSNPGELNGPTGLAFDKENNLYVVDSKNNRIQLFSSTGDFIRQWGNKGNGPGEFNNPWGLTLDYEGNVYVADWGNNRVQKFDSNDNYLSSFGYSEEREVCLNRPAHVAIDNEGDVYVTDWGNKRVQIYEPDGEIMASLYGDADDYSKAGLYVLNRDPESIKKVEQNPDPMQYLATFGRPTGIAITKNNRIVIADTRCRLQIYQKDNEYSEPPA